MIHQWEIASVDYSTLKIAKFPPAYNQSCLPSDELFMDVKDDHKYTKYVDLGILLQGYFDLKKEVFWSFPNIIFF